MIKNQETIFGEFLFHIIFDLIPLSIILGLSILIKYKPKIKYGLRIFSLILYVLWVILLNALSGWGNFEL